MDQFTREHADRIIGSISCFDRLLYKGHLPFCYPAVMEGFLASQGVLLKDFGAFVNRHSSQLKRHAQDVAQRRARPSIYLGSPVRKDDRVQAIVKRDQITEGLVCILAAVEACQRFRLAYGKGQPRLVSARRKCLCFYDYFVDREFGLMHVRITTWFPFHGSDLSQSAEGG